MTDAMVPAEKITISLNVPFLVRVFQTDFKSCELLCNVIDECDTTPHTDSYKWNTVWEVA
jgi:hypothetical protein